MKSRRCRFCGLHYQYEYAVHRSRKAFENPNRWQSYTCQPRCPETRYWVMGVRLTVREAAALAGIRQTEAGWRLIQGRDVFTGRSFCRTCHAPLVQKPHELQQNYIRRDYCAVECEWSDAAPISHAQGSPEALADEELRKRGGLPKRVPPPRWWAETPEEKALRMGWVP